MEWNEYYSDSVTMDGFIRYVTGFQQHIINAVKKYGNGTYGLEAGCAAGLSSIYLSHIGYTMLGIDNNTALIKKAQEANEYLRGSASFEIGDLFQLDALNRTFDFVFSQGVLEHFNEEQIVQIITAQLRISKRVIFSVPGIKHKVKDFGNENLWSYAKWVEILKPFKVVDSFGFLAVKGPISKVYSFALQILLPRVWQKIKVRHFDSQLGFVVELL